MNISQTSIICYIRFILIQLLILIIWAFYCTISPLLEKSSIPIEELIGNFNCKTLCGEEFAINKVFQNESNFKQISQKYNVDPDLLKSIMMEEMSHADPIERYPKYEKFLPDTVSKTRGVMQVTINSNQFYHKKINALEAADDFQSIDAAAFLLLHEREQLIKEGYEPTVETLATRYNNHSAKGVTRYGREVSYYYNKKPWTR